MRGKRSPGGICQGCRNPEEPDPLWEFKLPLRGGPDACRLHCICWSYPLLYVLCHNAGTESTGKATTSAVTSDVVCWRKMTEALIMNGAGRCTNFHQRPAGPCFPQTHLRWHPATSASIVVPGQCEETKTSTLTSYVMIRGSCYRALAIEEGKGRCCTSCRLLALCALRP